jgi:hypothetical protein
MRWLCLFLVLVCSGCVAPRGFLPTDPEHAIGSDVEGGTITHRGLVVTVRLDTWDGSPLGLDDVLQPVLIRIQNRGSRPVQIRYSDIRLVPAALAPRQPLPPFSIKGSVASPVDGWSYPAHRFSIAPHWHAHYPFFPSFHGHFDYDPFYYDLWYARYPQYVSVRLPTWDMISRALPEGVLEPDGEIAGYLYFEPIPSDVLEFQLSLDLVEARSIQPLGEFALPFHRR